MGLPAKVLAACRVLGIHHKQVMDYGFRGDSVVIIQGPVGFKFVVSPEAIEEFEARRKAEATAKRRSKRKADKKAEEEEE